MGLYERMLKLEPGKIPIHPFTALLCEVARNTITGAEARVAMDEISGVPLTAEEITEINTLFNTITGSNTAKLARTKQIDDIFILAESGVDGYATPSELRAKLGV